MTLFCRFLQIFCKKCKNNAGNKKERREAKASRFYYHSDAAYHIP